MARHGTNRVPPWALVIGFGLLGCEPIDSADPTASGGGAGSLGIGGSDPSGIGGLTGSGGVAANGGASTGGVEASGGNGSGGFLDCATVTYFECGFGASCQGSTVVAVWHVHINPPNDAYPMQIVSYTCRHDCPYGCTTTGVGWPPNGSTLIAMGCLPPPTDDGGP